MVQRILRKRLSAGCGTPEYRTLWEGYPAAEATWEPAESFAGCRGLLAAFERGLEPVVVAEVGVAAGREIIGIVRREAKRPAAPLGRARSYGTRSPLQDLTGIIDFTFRFPMPHGTVRHRRFHGNCSAAGIRI